METAHTTTTTTAAAAVAKPPAKSSASKTGANPNFGMNMPMMCSAFDTSAWLNAA